MAWTYRSRRYSSRSVRRSFRRRRLARPRYRRRYRRTYRRSRSTKSAVVKLTVEIIWTTVGPVISGGPTYQAFSFTPLDLPGFSEYQLTYSQFRILKCRLQVAVNTDKSKIGSGSYLIVPSRPFARNMGPTAIGDTTSSNFVPYVQEAALRQTRWQKVIYPSKVTSKISFGFKPYTLVASQGPTSVTSAQWPRVWECSRWMPFNWANTHQNDANASGGATGALYMYGPYALTNLPTGADNNEPTLFGTMSVYLQFRGQR